MIWLYILVGILCFLLGAVIMAKGVLKWNAGTLRIDSSDEDGPYLFLELEKTPDYLKECKYVLFTVNSNSYISFTQK